ncbi:MAG TPA: DUF6084 family protein [Pirellulales bacterium]|nr:DUF6084 family protein [Pirellulales bacterium]
MTDLSFHIEGAAAIRYAVSPQLAFTLRIAQQGEPPLAPIRAIALRCQIRIEPTRRGYDASAQQRLGDLFGTPERWGQTVRSVLWTHTGMVVPPFTESIAVELPVPCSFDFNVAATKYFAALDDGDVPLSLLFSGTIFYRTEDGDLQVAQISWDREAPFRLPISTWRAMMEHYYPNCAWLCLRRDAFDALVEYKSRRALPTWEQVVESLLHAPESRADGDTKTVVEMAP